MKFNQKLCSILGISSAIISICLTVLSFLNYINIYIAMIFLGFTEIFSGLNQINMAHQVDSKRFSKGNKKAGIFSIIVGIFLIITSIIKMIV